VLFLDLLLNGGSDPLLKMTSMCTTGSDEGDLDTPSTTN